MKKVFVGFVLIVALTTVFLHAQQHGIAGTWKFAMDTPHGAMTAELVLKQDGKSVTGVFVIADHGDLDVSGEFASGHLTLASGENGYMQMSLKGKLLEDGTLAGNLSSPMGNVVWTAERAHGK